MLKFLVADMLYTGEINDVLSDQELSKKTQDIEQDIPEAPEDVTIF
jgi:hypothetical protein